MQDGGVVMTKPARPCAAMLLFLLISPRTATVWHRPPPPLGLSFLESGDLGNTCRYSLCSAECEQRGTQECIIMYYWIYARTPVARCIEYTYDLLHTHRRYRHG
ncbi:hypothetical protein BDV95DRAFT_559839 [Massariosphaeria phaeospora]|uniref:Secreted protein n=1 Tax=Massariosphaeria phaeospora TaxID=100035 RepID=A0A7C8IIX5_9PLEO|nr:hypothetical protein BDV95DRAFT_559839 [Massariosphaeria phaeospora]